MSETKRGGMWLSWLCVQVDSRDTYQFTPLHSAANGGHVKTIQKLIHFSHDVDVKDYLGGFGGRIPARVLAASRELASLLPELGGRLTERC